MKETLMSKGQRGNKEAKKPKKAPAPAKPLAPSGLTPISVNRAALPGKK
jgi:hypothetical protein